MQHTIDAKEKELLRVFSDDYLFEIPTYQRPYAWTTEQTSELLDDLMVAMGDSGPPKSHPPYFLGSIVLIKESTQPCAAVVDGQQRLTTLTILFCVLRELSADPDTQHQLDKYVCERGDKFAGSEDRFRLALRERDRDFFRQNVQTPGKLRRLVEDDGAALSDSRQRIKENAAYLWRTLFELDQESRDRLAIFLVQRCFLVVVSASDQESAYRVFSVMNDRGLDLSPTDILKADVIGALPAALRETYNDKWESVEEELGRDDFRELFAHIRMIHVRAKARGNLSAEFRQGVLSRFDEKQFIDTLLLPLAAAYRIVSNAAYVSTADAEEVNAPLRHLNRLDNADWIPAAIAYFTNAANKRESLIRFTRDLERLAYALFILRTNLNNRIQRYAGVLQSIERGADLFADDSPLQLTPEEKRDVRTELDGPIYAQVRVRRPLLLRLDSLLADHGAIYDHRVISIEHVLPQTPAPGSVWVQWFPHPTERAEWVHRLANLVLLSHSKNTQASNFDFERKKKEYFQSGGVVTFAVTSQVLSEPKWTAEVLERRQRKLLGLLAEEWRLR